jgi:hypothetical protein
VPEPLPLYTINKKLNLKLELSTNKIQVYRAIIHSLKAGLLAAKG